MGDLWDRARDASQEREHRLGHEDPVKRKKYDAYKSKTKGKQHYYEYKEKQQESVTIDLSKKLKKL